ncbi:TPA: hypothetical protein ACT5CK_002296 [Flavobacterium psychrophilum]|uniref:hypothetical protein n=1 Tax=Flavobacterium psychrophilum TaxID=96345 RepID=UPI00073F9236|nr:hypothetical protein [Flavobacterium psychrophilum]GAQ50104.1 hypothetical protein FPK15_contig00102-0008 [Flavobacterium psychrophilum]GAW90627.1 hypothetical protein FPS14_contig00078-0002 [Flavobacterium psychrophilum]GEJ33916.1 hypothetical protein FPN185_contig00089-0002 [Flavobacterium psychrophilum]GEJ34131.1 hypothetical protein FPN181_contig00094-0002 [Flavobacterium psychrophilum]GEJ40656.1 hypothetical protein FPN187_contig00096-0002 [Flavobacterium psychrophilum]
MISYSSRSGKKSGVIAYEIGNDFIIVQFNGSKNYTYSNRSAGISAVNTMKSLAIKQIGLNTYISKNKPNPE